MPVLREDITPDLFASVRERNTTATYYLLNTVFNLGAVIRDFRISPSIVFEVHRTAVMFLSHTPGRYRDDGVTIKKSAHEPPPYWEVERFMDEYLAYLSKNWETRSATHLAAYAAWRLTWIHPFEDGNGRTALALCYLVLCLKHKMWLPGRYPLVKTIQDDPTPYFQALRSADQAYKEQGTIELTFLEDLLDTLLERQLDSRRPDRQ